MNFVPATTAEGVETVRLSDGMDHWTDISPIPIEV
jgi:hypothetical protein